MSEYSYCESVTASGSSPWHIRRLTDAGRKTGGGIDTDSLCGRVKAPYGWDLERAVHRAHYEFVCPTCYLAYKNGAQP